MTVFRAFDDLAAITPHVRSFLKSGMTSSIPVLVEKRTDLEIAISEAEDVYSEISPLRSADVGCVVDNDLPDALVRLLTPLAKRWLTETELLERNFSHRDTLLVVGRYYSLESRIMRQLIISSHAQTFSLSVLTGRDLPSLWWHTAKQYAKRDHQNSNNGLFSSIERSIDSHYGVVTHGERDLEDLDIRCEVLDQKWNKILFQGHGKDDSINLADFTVCGLNPHACRDDRIQGPRCAYGFGCYKPEEKLIPLNRVRAAEVVLSSCNSAPLSDLALYDPKFQLLLNAIDGTGQCVVAGITVHDSDRPENYAWQRAVRNGADSAAALNNSLRKSHPYPAYLRFGLPADSPLDVPAPPQNVPEPLSHLISNRLTGYLTGSLLAPSHPLRDRFTRLNRKIERSLARRFREDLADTARAEKELEGDLQSLDEAIMNLVTNDPEDDIMSFPSYFGDRSTSSEVAEEVFCHCGRPAQRIQHNGLTHQVLPTTAVVCFRCGDVAFSLAGGQQVLASSSDRCVVGSDLEVDVEVTGGRASQTRVGIFVPPYLRDHVTVQPQSARTRVRRSGKAVVRFALTIDLSTPPQAYYYTVFAVQDLGISTARRHFGALPFEAHED